MTNLVENILSGNLTEANELFESRIDEIMECKLYEEKRRVAAKLDEAFGGKEPAELRKKGYRRAIDVLGLSPYDQAKADRDEKLKKAKAAEEPKQEPKPEPARDASAMAKSEKGGVKSLRAKDAPRTIQSRSGKGQRMAADVEKAKELRARGSEVAKKFLRQTRPKRFASAMGSFATGHLKDIAKRVASDVISEE